MHESHQIKRSDSSHHLRQSRRQKKDILKPAPLQLIRLLPMPSRTQRYEHHDKPDAIQCRRRSQRYLERQRSPGKNNEIIFHSQNAEKTQNKQKTVYSLEQYAKEANITQSNIPKN